MTARTALVTGAGRRRGIGAAVTARLLADGGRVFAQSWSAYDAAQPYGAEAAPAEGPADASRLVRAEVDLADPAAPEELVRSAVAAFGPLDALVVNHTDGTGGGLGELSAAVLDRSLAVNVRATVLLVQAFLAQCPDGGRVVLMTSGQHLGPMPTELPYVAGKGAVGALVLSVSDAVAARGITVNGLNPGPTDTGWADEALAAQVAAAFPSGRWGTADEAAAVVSLLLSRDAQTMTGRVIDAEAGWRRWAT